MRKFRRTQFDSYKVEGYEGEEEGFVFFKGKKIIKVRSHQFVVLCHKAGCRKNYE